MKPLTNNMPKRFVIMPFHLPWNHSADYQRQTCLVLHKDHFIVAYLYHSARFFLKPQTRSPKYPKIKNLLFYEPKFVIPFRRFETVEKLNHLINLWYLAWRYGSRKRVILWIFDPLFYYFTCLNKLLPTFITIYDCVDFVWSTNKKWRLTTQTWEKKLILSVKYFFVNSRALFNLHKPLREAHKLVSQGFDINSFKQSAKPPLIQNEDKMTIGLVSTINKRLDFKLLEKLIIRNPDWHFVIWGRIQETEAKDIVLTEKTLLKLSAFRNVTVGCSVNRKEIPSVIKQFDVGIIPYDINQLSNLYSYPMKLFEYFYMGKPVVATPIEELKRFPKFVKLGNSAEGWASHIKQLLAKPWPQKYANEQRRLAEENSWEKKVSLIMDQLNNDKFSY